MFIFSSSSLSSTFVVHLFILCNIITATRASSIDTFVYGGCSRIKYAPNSQYEFNVNSLLTTLVNSAMYAPFNKYEGILSGVYQCRGDLSQSDCSSCIQHAVSQLGVLCGNSCGGAIQLDGCFVKYDNATFVGVEDKTVLLKKCGGGGYNSDELARRDQVLGYLASESSELYRVGSSGDGGVKGMGQCVGDLSMNECQDCLSYAIQRFKIDCASVSWGDMFLAKCYVRLISGGSHTNAQYGSSNDDEIEKTLAILIGLIAGVALLIIFLAFLRKLCEDKGSK